jgi:hypothetical protein
MTSAQYESSLAISGVAKPNIEATNVRARLLGQRPLVESQVNGRSEMGNKVYTPIYQLKPR